MLSLLSIGKKSRYMSSYFSLVQSLIWESKGVWILKPTVYITLCCVFTTLRKRMKFCFFLFNFLIFNFIWPIFIISPDIVDLIEFQSSVLLLWHVDVCTQQGLMVIWFFLFFMLIILVCICVHLCVHMFLCVCVSQGKVHFGAGHQGDRGGHQT